MGDGSLLQRATLTGGSMAREKQSSRSGWGPRPGHRLPETASRGPVSPLSV